MEKHVARLFGCVSAAGSGSTWRFFGSTKVRKTKQNYLNQGI